MLRLTPLLILAAVLAYVFLNFQTLRRDLYYKLGIANDPTTSCCYEADVANSTGDFDENAAIAIFNNKVIDYPKTSLAYAASQQINSDPQVLGTTNEAGEEKWIEVSLDKQRVRAWEGDKVVMEFPVSTGLWAPTPKGEFRIWHKTRSQTMSGGSKELGTYYYLPNVPNNMFFYQGYALHGAYWHNNFGHPMSHGCVNEPLASAAQIFEWAGPVVLPGVNYAHATAENPGTRVLVR